MFLRMIETLSSWSGWLAGIGIVIMAGVITVDVFLRYVLGDPLLFADDVSVYCMIFITFVGAALTLKMKRHIAVDMLYVNLPRRVQLWLDVVTTFFSCFITWVLTWYTIVWVRNTYYAGHLSQSILATPMWIPMSVVPLGLFLLGLQCIVECVKVVRTLRDQENHTKEDPAHA